MVEYYYLVSSLPMLQLGSAPALSVDAFLAACRAALPPDSYAALAAVSLEPSAAACCPAHGEWLVWEVFLRNALVRLRAAALQMAADEWLRPEPEVFPADRRRLEEIARMSDVAARERALDDLRWQRLDAVILGREFRFDALVVYKLRLLLATRWAQRSDELGGGHLTGLVEAGVGAAEKQRRQVESRTDS